MLFVAMQRLGTKKLGYIQRGEIVEIFQDHVYNPKSANGKKTYPLAVDLDYEKRVSIPHTFTSSGCYMYVFEPWINVAGAAEFESL